MDELRALAPDIYCLGECWSGENEILEYCSAVNCFNFAMAQAEGTVASAAKGSSISRFTGYMESYQQKVLQADPDGMVIGFLSNHDMDRIAGAFILDSNMRMAANLYLLCCGSPVIYYGEEMACAAPAAAKAPMPTAALQCSGAMMTLSEIRPAPPIPTKSR